jgi:riboflavin biosynthesis pyrimidine reductase
VKDNPVDKESAATVTRVDELSPRGTDPLGPGDLLELLDRARPAARPDRPAVVTNMVMSIDGAYAVEGRSGGLSSPADHALFLAQRSLADAILVGASTARQERYRRPTVDPGAAAIRARRGQAGRPLLVIASRRAALPSDLPLLTGEEPEPLLACPDSTDTSALPAGIGVLRCGATGVDFAALLGQLHGQGARLVVCEGGPALLGQLAAADLIDEYLLTVSPHLVGGSHVGLLGGAQAAPPGAPFALHRMLRDGDHLMLSYRRA